MSFNPMGINFGAQSYLPTAVLNGNVSSLMGDAGPASMLPGGMAPMSPFDVTGALTPKLGGGGSPFGLNMGTAQLALSGIGTLGSLWGAFQANKLAKEQFRYTKDITETNMANQLKTFNSALTDRANNRAIVEGRSPAETQAYIDANKLSRFGR